MKIECSKLAKTIVHNAFSESYKSYPVEKYYYHIDKMNYLYILLHKDKLLSIEELLYQCMRLEQKCKEKYLNLISQTSVILLKNENIFEYEQMSRHELNAHKTMYIALDCIDLLMNTYEPDYDEACQKLKNNLMSQHLLNLVSSPGDFFTYI